MGPTFVYFLLVFILKCVKIVVMMDIQLYI